MGDVAWHSVDPAPIVLLHGTEPLLAQRALERIRRILRERDPETAVHELGGEGAATSLAQVASPSLFGEPRLVIVRDLQSAPEALVREIDAYRAHPEDDVTLVLVHRGGQRGKKLLDALRAAGVPRVACDPIKRPADKQAFVTAEFSRADRRIRPEAAAALVDAFGGDLSELAAVSRQLIEDTTPEQGSGRPDPVGIEEVRSVTAGRVESTAFAVADAAISGRDAQALVLLQQASLAGVDPVPLVAAVARKVRDLAKVSAPGADARRLGMPDWMLRNLLKEARAWDDRSLARALEAVARADHEVKGAGRDPRWSVQRMVTEICRARARRP